MTQKSKKNTLTDVLRKNCKFKKIKFDPKATKQKQIFNNKTC